MNLCEPCTCSPPLLVMLIPEGDEEHVRGGAQISGRIARSNEWMGYDLYRFPFSQSRWHGRWRGFLLEKGGKELYSGGRGRGRGGFPCVRNLLDKSLIGKYKNEKTPTRNVASNVSMLARWFCLLILLYFGSEQDRTCYRVVAYVYKKRSIKMVFRYRCSPDGKYLMAYSEH